MVTMTDMLYISSRNYFFLELYLIYMFIPNETSNMIDDLVVSAMVDLPDLEMFETTSGCYGDTMNATCKEGEVIAIAEAHIGVKPSYLNCSVSLSITSDFETCCVRNASDCTFPLASYEYCLLCNGRTSCVLEIEQRLDFGYCTEPNKTGDDNTTDIFLPLRHYMFMEYFCIEKARLMDLCYYSTSLSVHNTSVYVWNYNSVKTTYKDIGSYCACSVEIDNCNSQLQIYSLFMDSTINESVGTCNQSITVFNSTDKLVLTLQCQEDNSTPRMYTVNDTYIQIKMSVENDNFNFLTAIRASNEADLMIHCPPSAQRFCTSTADKSPDTPSNIYFTVGLTLAVMVAALSLCSIILVCEKRRKQMEASKEANVTMLQYPFSAQRVRTSAADKSPDTTNNMVFSKERRIKRKNAEIMSQSETVNLINPSIDFFHLERSLRNVRIKPGKSNQSDVFPHRRSDVSGNSKYWEEEDEGTQRSKSTSTSVLALNIYQGNTSERNKEVETEQSKTQMETVFCKEITVTPYIEPRVQVVKPLKTSTKKYTEGCSKPVKSEKEQKEISSCSNIDWNTVFRRLIQMLPATNWKLFFICLYGYGEQLNVFPAGMSIDGKITQIEARVDTKQAGVETLFFELFKEWRELFGEHTDPCYIENALSERGYNDVLNKFKDIMRNPPLLRSCNTSSLDSHLVKTQSSSIFPQMELNFHKPVAPVFSYALHQHQQSQQATASTSTSLDVRCRQSNEVAVHLHNMAACSQSYNNNEQICIGECSKYLTMSAYTRPFVGMKRHFTTTESDSDELISKKNRKQENHRLPKRRLTRTRSRRLDKYCRKSENHILAMDLDEKDFIDLIMRYLPFEGQVLNEKEYTLFLDHTISNIKRKTSKSEKEILFMSCTDYQEVQEYKSKRFGHVHFVIETESSCMTLDKEEWDCLKLYADHARKRVVKRCGRAHKYVESKYMFIRFDGTPLLEQLQESDSDEQVSIVRSCNTSGTISFTGAQMSSDNKSSTPESKAESSNSNYKNDDFSLGNTEIKLDRESHPVSTRKGRRNSI